MISERENQIADKAKRIYAERLRKDLEANHLNRFVAIEPESGDYFLADSIGQAAAAARSAHPKRLSFVIRVGHQAAVNLGGMSS